MGFFSSILGEDSADAAQKAAADTYAKQTTAVNNYQNYGNTLPAQYASIYQPYSSAGTSALKMLQAGLGLGGDSGAFTAAYHNLPGYQSGLDTGLQAAQRKLQSGGGLNNGGALKALFRYGSDYEDQKSGDYLSRLAGVASGLGLPGAAGTAGGIAANTGVQGQAYQGAYGSAPTIGQGDVAAAQAKSDAMTNLLKMGTYLAGVGLSGGMSAAGGMPSLKTGSAYSPGAQQTNFWNSGYTGPV